MRHSLFAHIVWTQKLLFDDHGVAFHRTKLVAEPPIFVSSVPRPFMHYSLQTCFQNPSTTSHTLFDNLCRHQTFLLSDQRYVTREPNIISSFTKMADSHPFTNSPYTTAINGATTKIAAGIQCDSSNDIAP